MQQLSADGNEAHLIHSLPSFLFGDFTNILNNKPPIMPPYKLLLNGFEVMAHVPDAQPTK